MYLNECFMSNIWLYKENDDSFFGMKCLNLIEKYFFSQFFFILIVLK